ncbi:MAG: nucleotidyltransferase domain-containing protein [Anaerovoracaceae bacterium]
MRDENTILNIDEAASKELESIKQAILDTLDVHEIYLFGSFAYGTPNANSDFDIYVVTPDDSMRPIEAMQKIGKAISRKDIRAVDILVGKLSQFEEQKVLPSIERRIFRDGVKLYGQDSYN